MNEPTVPPPPQYPPPPPVSPGGVSPNRGLMLVLAYLGPLAVIPLVAEKDDSEVQWHAKHGLVLLVAEVALGIVVSIAMHIPVLGCLTCFVWPFIGLGILVLHIFCIVKANKGERLRIPVLTDYADRF